MNRMRGVRIALILLAVLHSISVRPQTPSILNLSQSIQLQQANIWGGISYNGENLSVTTTFFQNRPHLFLRKPSVRKVMDERDFGGYQRS